MKKQLNRKNHPVPCRPVKVLQFGEGNFLRAFTDWMIDIMNEKTGFNGAIQVVQPLEQGTGNLLNDQHGLYHVVLKGLINQKTVNQIRLITSVNGAINPYRNYSLFLKQAENPDLKFVISNTTEAGICFNPADNSPEQVPLTFPGKLTALLFHRFKYFNESSESGLILLPCELIDKNADTLKSVIGQYIEHWNLPAAFRTWVETQNIFCNTLVDRIVPGYPKDFIDEIEKETGFTDQLTVMGEPFHLWVIEGDESVERLFPAKQANLNVKFVIDVTPYRTRKVRILNGAHTAMVPVAYLRGLRTVQEAMEDRFTGNFIRAAVFEEILPTLDLPEEELKDFATQVLERFVNPFIRHELASISLNSISKFRVRVLPTVLEYVKRKHNLPQRLVFSLAALIRFYKGSWQGASIPLNDTADVLQFAQEAWKHESVHTVAQSFLSNSRLWDFDLTTIPGLTVQVTKILQQLETEERVYG